jgi:hypothetical protein
MLGVSIRIQHMKLFKINCVERPHLPFSTKKRHETGTIFANDGSVDKKPFWISIFENNSTQNDLFISSVVDVKQRRVKICITNTGVRRIFIWNAFFTIKNEIEFTTSKHNVPSTINALAFNCQYINACVEECCETVTMDTYLDPSPKALQRAGLPTLQNHQDGEKPSQSTVQSTNCSVCCSFGVMLDEQLMKQLIHPSDQTRNCIPVSVLTSIEIGFDGNESSNHE